MMKGRILSPPARPLALVPRTTDRAEHVPTHDGGTDTGSSLREEGIVDPLITAFSADHLPAAAGSEDPFVESGSPNPEGILEVLVGPRAVAIERDRVVAHKQSGHPVLLLWSHYDEAGNTPAHSPVSSEIGVPQIPPSNAEESLATGNS